MVGALILIAAYFVGVALLGAGIGALATSLIWASLGREPSALDRDRCSRSPARSPRSRCSATSSSAPPRSAGPGRSSSARSRSRATAIAVDAAARNNVWLAYPMNPAPGQYWVLLAWLGLGIAGAFVQLAVTAKGKKEIEWQRFRAM